MKYKSIIGFIIISCMAISSVEGARSSSSSSSSQALAVMKAANRSLSHILPTSLMQLIMEYNGAPRVPKEIRHTIERWEMRPYYERSHYFSDNNDNRLRDCSYIYSPDHSHIAIISKRQGHTLAIINRITGPIYGVDLQSSSDLRACPFNPSWSCDSGYFAYIDPFAKALIIIANNQRFIKIVPVLNFAWSTTTDDMFAILQKGLVVSLYKIIKNDIHPEKTTVAPHAKITPYKPCKSIRSLIIDSARSLLWDKRERHSLTDDSFYRHRIWWVSEKIVICCGSSTETKVVVCNLTGEISSLFTIMPDLCDAQVSPDNSCLAVAHRAGITVYDLASSEIQFDHETATPITKLIWLNKNTLCTSTRNPTSTVMIINTQNNTVRTLVKEEQWSGTFHDIQYSAHCNELITVPFLGRLSYIHDCMERMDPVHVWQQIMDWKTMSPYLGYAPSYTQTSTSTAACPSSPVLNIAIDIQDSQAIRK